MAAIRERAGFDVFSDQADALAELRAEPLDPTHREDRRAHFCYQQRVCLRDARKSRPVNAHDAEDTLAPAECAKVFVDGLRFDRFPMGGMAVEEPGVELNHRYADFQSAFQTPTSV